MIRSAHSLTRAFLVPLIIGLVCYGANAGVQVIGVQYQQDKYFPEDYCLWHDRQYPGPCSINLNTGQVVKVFLKNTGASSVTVSDVTLAGRSLNHDIRQVTQGDNNPSSIYFANLSSGDLQTDVSAGEPVWYKADPATIPAGGVGQAVLRLRVLPVTQPISMGVVTSGGTVTTNITVDATAPALASVGFSPDRTKVYLHWRRNGGAAPTAILMDGNDVTGNATTVGDPTLGFGATVLQFSAPLGNMSYHVYQGVFSDGKRATGALRTWVNPFLYGTWAAKPTSAGAPAGQAWVNEATAHGVNVCVMNVASDGLADLMSTSSGRQWMDDHGYGVVKDDPSSASQILRMWFIRDEPDGAEGNVTGLPAGAGHNPGVLAMSALARGEVLRAAKMDVPVTVNIDGNLKPYNYWNWGQVPDVFMTDPYYQPEVADAYLNNTAQIPLYAKATQVYATARTAGLACEPNPLHVILYSCKQNSSSVTWPFPAAGTKRTEVYYALAGGAKGLAYWWYKAPDGLGAGNADALALWKEIGLLGDEIKTAQPLLVTSHPVTLTTASATAGVWFRTLAVGIDTMIFLVVNDNHYNDVTGCHYTAITNATLNATLPSWLASSSAFEITPSGLNSLDATITGTQMQLNLGTLNLTRMIVVTADPQLRTTIQTRYVEQVWPGICQIAPEYCTPQTVAPSITVQPSGRDVALGGSASFEVVAGGTGPLSYRWQKNNTNLSDSGHYTGCTTDTLGINGAGTNDEASYRCIVTNTYGSATSGLASLTLVGGCTTPVLLDGSFEGPYNGSGVSSNWISYQRAPNPAITLWSIQNASPPTGGGFQYQQIANTNSTGGGGVRQDVTGCAIGATYLVSGWMRGNSASATCRVRASPSASTSWSTAIDLNPPQTYSGSTWTAFGGTVVATGTNMTIWLDGQTTGAGLFKAECFDMVSVSCVAGPPAAPATFDVTGGGAGCVGVGVLVGLSGSQTSANYYLNRNVTSAVAMVAGTGAALNFGPQTIPGTYTVTATNATVPSIWAGMTGTAEVTSGATTIAEQPAGAILAAGGTTNFDVAATGSGTLVFQWQANQTNIHNGGHYSGCTTAMLTISGADTNDAADYRCVVTGDCGSATSSNATLTCVTAAPLLYFASVEMLPENRVQLVVTGAPGHNVTIERSSDLVAWLPLTNLVNTNGTLPFTDTPASNALQQFYRASSP